MKGAVGAIRFVKQSLAALPGAQPSSGICAGTTQRFLLQQVYFAGHVDLNVSWRHSTSCVQTKQQRFNL